MRKKIIIFILVVISAFLYVYFNGEKIQTISTFPRMGKEMLKIDNVDKIYLKNSDGEKISGIYLNNDSDKIIFYFHGNGGPLNMFEDDINFIAESTGYDLIAYDFPGYGESEGFPTEEKLYEATELFYNYIKDNLKKKDDDIISFGYSVGTSLATDFAYKYEVSKLILFSPFTSRYSMNEFYLGFNLSKSIGLKNSLVSLDKIKEISSPTLIVHGNNDNIVPFYMGIELYKESIAEDKYFIEVDNFGHVGFFETYPKQLEKLLKAFVFDEKIVKNELKISENVEFFDYFIDMDTDDSYQKFLSANVPFNNKKYLPSDLVDIKDVNLVNLKYGLKLRKEAFESLKEMAADYNKETGRKIKIASSYRGYAYQKGIIDRGCSPKFCSKPGYSEHQSGLGLDFFEASSERVFLSKKENKIWFEWMNKNAQKYGFHNTYQKGVEIDTYHIEPWHWRYVGDEFATYLKENNLTIAEYYNLRNREGN